MIRSEKGAKIMYNFLTLNDTVILRKTEGNDEYGLPLVIEESEVLVKVTDINSLKTYQNHGQLGVVAYEISFPADVEVSTRDTVVINGEEMRFKTLQRFRDFSGNIIYTKVTV